jgi:hypothetical protein
MGSGRSHNPHAAAVLFHDTGKGEMLWPIIAEMRGLPVGSSFGRRSGQSRDAGSDTVAANLRTPALEVGVATRLVLVDSETTNKKQEKIDLRCSANRKRSGRGLCVLWLKLDSYFRRDC